MTLSMGRLLALPTNIKIGQNTFPDQTYELIFVTELLKRKSVIVDSWVLKNSLQCIFRGSQVLHSYRSLLYSQALDLLENIYHGVVRFVEALQTKKKVLARDHPRGNARKVLHSGRLWSCLQILGLVWIVMSGTNTLAYYEYLKIKAIRSFITLTLL